MSSQIPKLLNIVAISVSWGDPEVNSPLKRDKTLTHLRFWTLWMYIPDTGYLVGYDIHIKVYLYYRIRP